jgi:hypothetical protein
MIEPNTAYPTVREHYFKKQRTDQDVICIRCDEHWLELQPALALYIQRNSTAHCKRDKQYCSNPVCSQNGAELDHQQQVPPSFCHAYQCGDKQTTKLQILHMPERLPSLPLRMPCHCQTQQQRQAKATKQG